MTHHGFNIDRGDPASKVAQRVSSHAFERWCERLECGSLGDARRQLLEEMRAAKSGALEADLAVKRLRQHEGKAADYYVTDRWCLVVVDDPDGRSLLATIYRRSKKYATPDVLAHRHVSRRRHRRRQRALAMREDLAKICLVVEKSLIPT